MSKLSTLFAPASLFLLAIFFLPLSCQKSESAPPVSPLTFQITRTKDGKPMPNATIKLWKETGPSTPSELVETLGKTDALGMFEWKYSKDSLPNQYHFSCSADGYDSLLISFNTPLDKKFTGQMSQSNLLAPLTFQITRTKDGKPLPNATIKLWKETGPSTPNELVETLGKTDDLGMLEWKYSKGWLPKQHHFSCSANSYDSILISINNPLDKKFMGQMSQSNLLAPLTFQITRTKDGKPLPNATIRLWKETGLYTPSELVETLGKTDALGMLEWTYSKDSLPNQHHFSCSADGYNGILISINNPLDNKFTGKMSQIAQVNLHAAFTDTVLQKCLCYYSFVYQPNQHYPAINAKQIFLSTKSRTQLDTTISFSIPLSQWSNEIICHKFDPSYVVTPSLYFPNTQNRRSYQFPAPTVDSTFVIDFKW